MTKVVSKTYILHNKGQLVSKCLFGVFNFFQKTNENKSTWGFIAVKLNSFIRFLEETSAWKNHFEFVWPLEKAFKIRKYKYQISILSKKNRLNSQDSYLPFFLEDGCEVKNFINSAVHHLMSSIHNL